jgi:Xaa-Pro aminopeptidase
VWLTGRGSRPGLDYRHGTGHGVGAFLNVHEGPHGIGTRITLHEAALEAGMTVRVRPSPLACKCV